MCIEVINRTIKIPHLLLIAGNGRNSGKTFLACKIIQHFSKITAVTGVKITNHFHEVKKEDILIENERFIIAEENQITLKDSSLMKQAGSERVFFVMAKKEYLKEAVEKLVSLLPETAIVCESGGLHEFVTPGLFLFIKRTGDNIVKTHLIEYSPTIINNNGEDFNLNIQNIEFEQNKFNLLKQDE